MELFALILIVSIFYIILLFFDSFFKSCMHYPYDAFLKNTGLSVKFFRLQWHTTALNRFVLKWRHICPRLLSKCFDIGVYVTLIILPTVTLGLIVSTFYSFGKGSGSSEPIKLQIVLPFVTLPIEEIPYYVIALTVCSICHELGHAVAAALEDVRILGFGMHVIFFIPLAYTEVDGEYMSTLRIWRRLKVLCAGIWNNIVFGLVCYLMLACVPQLASSFYNINDSVIVTSIKPRSPVQSSNKGLHVSDIITHINDCRVKNVRSWYGCLQEAIQYQPSYCLSTDFVRNNDESVLVSHNNQIIECCDPKNHKSICFEHILEKFDEEPEVPQYLCLDIRKSIEQATGYCNRNQRCKEGLCFRPVMDNLTTIFQIQRWYQHDMIYIGHSNDFSRTVKVSEYVPKTTWLPSHVADTFSLMLRYFIVFSFGLAFTNAVPCFGFDGQHLVNALMHNFRPKGYDKARRDMIALCINLLGTLLIFILVTKSIWTSLLSHIF